MRSISKWLHRKGIHRYSIPIKRFNKQLWHVEGDAGAGAQEKFQTIMRYKCQHCNKRKNKVQRTVTRTWGD